MKKGRTISIGTELQSIIKKERITGYRISKETGIGQSYISRILHDKANPNCLTLNRILDVLGYQICFKKISKSQKERR